MCVHFWSLVIYLSDIEMFFLFLVSYLGQGTEYDYLKYCCITVTMNTSMFMYIIYILLPYDIFYYFYLYDFFGSLL